MASYPDLLDAIARIRSVTGDPNAWKKGLTGDDVTTVCNPASPPAALGAVLAKLTAAHPDVFLAPSPAGPQAPPPRIGEGAAADAIRDAETALAHQNSTAAHVDLQVVTAVLNAHAAHDDGLAELVALQRDIEGAVASRTDLDTPAGAREFQRYLIGKLRDIRNVVENAGLDATSRACVAAALATLYASSTPDSRETTPAGDRQSDSGPPASQAGLGGRGETAGGTASVAQPAVVVDPGPDLPAPTGAVDALPVDPFWSDSPLPGLPAGSLTAPIPPSPAVPPPVAPVAPVAPMPAPAISPPAMAPPPWSGGLPSGAPFGGGIPALAAPPVTALPDLPRSDRPEPTTADAFTATEPPSEPAVAASDNADEAPGTVVDLPDGDTVTAPTPELAAVITAAVGGTPIPEAFRLQGITLPPPASPVIAPLDPAALIPGDVGLLTDRHALALGNGKVLLDQRIQPIASVNGPGFLGWQHPPEPEPTNVTPDPPAPNRAAATAPS